MTTLTTNQQAFLNAVEAGRNIFLTGKAGTGKSFIVRMALERLKEANKKVIAVAPTGIAANNIDGQTIHSLFRINPFGVLTFDTCNFVNKQGKEVLKQSHAIVVDEVSMLRPDIFDAMNWTMIKNGLEGLIKKQVIIVGDMKQLPPILDDNTRSVLYQQYNGDTFEHADIFEKLDFITIELDEVLRQSNEDFIEALNVIREGGKHQYFKRFVSDRPNNGVILAPHNATVTAYNEAGLAAQEGEIFTFIAETTGDVKVKDFNLENEIQVKTGCKIMYLVNSKNNPLRNGTLGTFIEKKGMYYIRINETDFALEKVMLTKKEYVYNKKADKLELRELGSITQYPFKLAYALSIHKSQGLTFDECTIDLRRSCFQKGQMYVALSRVRSPEGLCIIV